MNHSTFYQNLISDPTFNSCSSAQQRTIYVVEKLLRTSVPIELVTAQTVESALDQLSLRYREVKLDKDFFRFDFGTLLIVKQSLKEYHILTRSFGDPRLIRVSPSFIDIVKPDNSDLSLNSTDIGYEVYPALPYSISNIKDFLSFVFGEFTSDIYLLIFYTLVTQGTKALFPFLTVYVTTTVISLGSLELVYQVGFVAIVLSLFATVALYLQSRIVQKLESESDRRAQTAIWDRLMKIDLSFIAPYKPSDLVTRASAITQVRTLLSSSNITSLISLLFSVVYLVEMYVYLPVATLLVIPLLVLFILVVILKARSGKVLLTGSLEVNADLIDISNTIFRGVDVFSSSRVLPFLEEYWHQLQQKSADFSYKYRQKDNSLDTFSASFQSLSFLLSFFAIIIYSGNNLSDTNFLAQVIGYTSALTLFCTSLSAGTVSIVNSLINVLAYWERAKPIAFSPIEQGYNVTCYPVDIEGDIQIEDLTFSYTSDLSPVFQDLNLSFKKGQVNSFSLPPGSGTTSFFRLLLGLYQPTSGSILYDSHLLHHIQISSLRSQVKLAPQELYIPTGNLYRLFRGPLSATDSDLSDFINAFGLADFIGSLRMGIDTPLANGGNLFPLKQRQLFSLAYAASQAPRVLLIDNCTSELSSIEVDSIFNFLILKGFTVVVSGVDTTASLSL